jgi:hypothetical protein
VSFDAKRLYELLPAIYRIRDAEQGKPIEAMISVIAEQIAVLEENLAQIYDDQFIETCADWAVSYIGDLIGYHSLYGITPQVRSPRAEVANTINYRRHKGTVSMLEQLARDVTGWYAHVVEEFQLLATTQYMNHLRPGNLYTPDLRFWEKLEHLNTPFDSLVHTVDVRNIASGRECYNISNIGIFLWRLEGYSLTNSPARKLDELDDYRYLFSPLGNNTQLFNNPKPGKAYPAQPINLPMPISRRVLDSYLDDYYGRGKSLLIRADNYPDLDQPLKKPSDLITVCDLSDIKDTGGNIVWAHSPKDKIAIDPVLGRIAFPKDRDVPENVMVTFHYGFSADMGGGEYDHEDPADPTNQQSQTVNKVPSQQHPTIRAALNDLPNSGVVEISNNGCFKETLIINAASEGRIELRAANRFRPSIVLPDGPGGELQISSEEGSEVVLNGLLISGNSLRVVETASHGKLKRLRLQHCTLVPGISLSTDGKPKSPLEPSLVIETNDTIVEIDSCIIGGMRVVEGANVQITNSIVDATSECNVAYAALDGTDPLVMLQPGGMLHIENSTIIGKVNTMLMELASNTIFLARLAEEDKWTAPVRAERRQQGCVHFSYLPPASQVPRRYYCQPVDDSQAARVHPQFTSLRYGDAGYCQLSRCCADEIRKGADDEAEMGAFHNLYHPQRETDLLVRLNEYLRFGLEAGIIYVT